MVYCLLPLTHHIISVPVFHTDSEMIPSISSTSFGTVVRFSYPFSVTKTLSVRTRGKKGKRRKNMLELG